MNRLILVGNGFDLAHGLRTSYKDFIFWYLDSSFNGAGIYANGEFYEDELINVSILEHYRFMDLRDKAKNTGISRYLYDKGLLNIYLNFGFYDDLDTINVVKEQYTAVSKLMSHSVVFKCGFLKKLIDSCLGCGWVDIEQEYFDALKKYNDSDHSHDIDYIRTINKNFEFLKGKLEEYLLIEEQRDIEVIPELIEAMRSDFSISDFDTAFNSEDVTSARNTTHGNGKLNQYKLYLLNFNYTNTLRKYYKEIANTEKDDYELSVESLDEFNTNKFRSYAINHIHGELKNPTNPIIFGFGDEHDKEYLQFEEQKNNTLFEHVKSYHYLKTSNYRNLMRFLNLNHYQVFIIGHSCGLSDRTMFKEIFDHDNCKSVRIFHYNDFFDKSINLSRHFSDKGRMRKLVVEFNPADAIMQGNKN
ncbi:AbiH family protein [Sphingobacterium multivorum]|uniref:AbiH family protein n=1 Tax=Sphingobacterium multivorum TaxID=28454 RepID=UPI00345E1D72